ncbi:LamG-like jellyroll fold domain-containing protein, partial [Candidatus Nitrosotenuis chungbukensis]|uniref:LamG-like jellyroll fold domain-containing protein n=1 Tax=Candidatus Nitrosotenuis chungbukensis TaxID=1353246 RepID=UPI002A4E23B3
MTIPNATQSWAFNKTVNGSQFIGDVNLNQTGLIFDGGFVKSAGNYTNQTSNIAITAWIKPDYSSGSSMFTIVSKENSFELTLDNISENVATFSIFDGIKWHSVSTVSEIGQGWSHVAATFNGTDISIYTNGTISSTEKTIQTVSVSSEGTIENTIPQVSSTDTDVVIGATLDARAVDKAQKVFSGGIDQLEIYDRYLTAEQIHEIYTRTLPIILAKYVNNTTIQTVEIPPISLLNQTSVNGTLNTNSTEYVIVPTVNQTSQMTISTWVTPQYNGAAAELTILSKEGSFVLSLNNVISPEHAAKFAVFDGIRWTAAQGTNKIHDKSHVVAVINGTEISLYVNGVLQERQTLPKSFIISEDDLVVSEVADSESDIVIGAYISTVRSEPKLSNKFSGVISDVVVYSKALEQDEIKQLYHSISNTELSLFESLEVSDSVYSKLIFQNDTIDVLIVEPILNQTKSSYLINEDVEFQLQYYDDYEVLLKQLKEMKDNLSVLTKNTEQNLTQIETQIVNGDIDANINQKESSRNSINIKPINYVISTFIPMAHADNPLSSSSFNVLNEIAKTKEKIQELREKINLINQNGTTDERLLYEIKDQIETISENLRSVSGNMTGVSLSAKSKQINNLAETFESMVTENVTEVQYDKWQEQNNVITAEIYDPQGKLIDTISQYEKVREGKFNIKLSPEKIVTPGMYHIKTTLQIDGKQYVMEDEFAWGLVSLNTKKSIYKPGEIADFVIVVLDNGGHPVCNSNLVMTVTDPQLQKSVLSSNDGITTNQECGLYDSIYHTNTEGNYTIDITAQTPNGATSFSTYFTVKQDFDYDIIRTAQSKIDPITNPNSFNVTINIESFIGSEPITIREFVPIHFNVTTNGAVENINGTQIITWEKSLIENKTSVSYKYSIPLIFPKLYTLGKVEIAQNNSTFTEARNWYVAADPLTIVEFEENLGFTDINEIAPYANSIILNENLGMEDNNFGPGTGTIILLTENLGITGSKLLVVNSPISLTENLGMTDTVTT